LFPEGSYRKTKNAALSWPAWPGKRRVWRCVGGRGKVYLSKRGVSWENFQKCVEKIMSLGYDRGEYLENPAFENVDVSIGRVHDRSSGLCFLRGRIVRQKTRRFLGRPGQGSAAFGVAWGGVERCTFLNEVFPGKISKNVLKK